MLVASVAAVALTLPSSALADNLCVGTGPSCFATIQAAVDAASNGDTIKVGPGAFAGGVTVDKSVRLVGAGADRTTVRGGGPVLTIGSFGESDPPTVTIAGLRITDGISRSSPQSVPFIGEEGVWAGGGGVEIPPDEDFTGGATVTIRDTVISGNRVAPSQTVDGGPPCPGGDPCPFARATGGGIESWGNLRVVDTTVTDNRIGSAAGLSNLASDSDGGGIASWLGSVALIRSVVDANQATAVGPVGRFAEGGGVFIDSADLRVRDSSVSHNEAALAASLPNSVEQLAIGGGMQVGGGVPSVRIAGSTFAANSITATNRQGDGIAFSGGFNIADIGIDVRVEDSVVARNEVSAAALGVAGDAEGDTGGANPVGVVVDTRFVENEVRVRSAAGDATAAGAGTLIRDRMVGGAVIGNRAQASSPKGEALAAGGGIVVDSVLTLNGTAIRANTASATGARGAARGGGIFDGPLFSNGGALTLVDTTVEHNVATGSARIALEGGGIYIPTRRLTMIRSSVSDNVPDEICGC